MKAMVLACLALVAGAAAGIEVREEMIDHAGVRFRVVRVHPESVQVVWKDASGVPYRTFDKVQARFAKEKKTVKFLMNAGIFEPGGTPSGLHLENGKILHPLNPRDGEGNFFLKPNGVFSAGRIIGPPGAGHAEIRTTEAVADAERKLAEAGSFTRTARVQIQSGPLLLIGGKRHPAFKEGSANKLHRNGVGVDGKGQVVFAITEWGQVVNFWDFAGLFAVLGCKDALFLDGDLSQMAVNPPRPVESNQFGAILVIAE